MSAYSNQQNYDNPNYPPAPSYPQQSGSAYYSQGQGTGQPYGGQPYAGQPYAGQPYGGQPYGGQPYGGQPYGGQPYGQGQIPAQPPAYSVPIPSNRSPGDSEAAKYEPQQGLSGFDEKSVRLGFIRKVYSILMCQLLVTGAVMALFMYVEDIKSYVQENSWLMFTSWGVAFACIIVLACCGDVRRKSPGNFICLAVFTVCESFMLGTVATFYSTDAVLMAVGTTAAVTLALTLFAFQTKIDFTGCGAVLLCVLVIFIISGIFLSIFGVRDRRAANIGYSAVGCLIFSLYLIYDTQIMLGGKHKYSLSPEEYIFAALNLYLDIINLFLYLLSIFGNSKN